MISLLIGVLPLVTLATARTARAANAKKIALLIGISKYESQSIEPLNGTLNDVRDMDKVLRGPPYGFTDVRILRNEEATHSGIIAAIQEQLIAKAGPDDIVVLYFSGHGSRMKDPAEIDGYSSTIVPYDSRDDAKRITDIRNRELNGLLRKIGTANKTVILDSCYSGMAFRGLGKSKAAPEDTRFGDSPPPLPQDAAPVNANSTTDTSGFSTGNAKYVLLAASRSNQVAFEYKDPDHNEDHGVFTYFLAAAMQAPSSNMTNEDVMGRVSENVVEVYSNQNPQLDGPNRHVILFGDKSITSPKFVRATGAGERLVTLHAGASTNVTVGSRYDIYGADSHSFRPPEQPLAAAVVKNVSASTAVAELNRVVQISTFAKGVERQHQYDAVSMRVVYDSLATAPILAQIKSAYEAQPDPPRAEAVNGPPYQLRVTEEIDPTTHELQVHVRGASGADIRRPIPSSDAGVVARTVDRLDAMAQWFSTLSLQNRSANASIGITVTPSAGNKGVSKGEFGPGKTPGFIEGDSFSLNIRNNGMKKLYVYILDMTENGSIQLAFPYDEGEEKTLPAGQSFTVSDLHAQVADEGRLAVLDILKVIATSQPIPVEFFQQNAPRGPQLSKLDPLGQMIARARQGRREITSGNPDDWVTTQVEVLTTRAQ